MGQTATGKTKLTIKLYKLLPIEVISIDSIAVYKFMNIGTSKPNSKELALVPHRLINICNPDRQYSLFEFYKDLKFEIESIIQSNKIPFLVGGTMLYFKVIVDGINISPPPNMTLRERIKRQAESLGWSKIYEELKILDPIAISKIHVNDKVRILRLFEILKLSKQNNKKIENIYKNYEIYKFAIIPPEKNILKKRIKTRFFNMLEYGLEKEVYEIFIKNNIKDNVSSLKSIGYYQMWQYLSKKISYNQMILNSIKATYRFAKNQKTWLKKWPDIIWINDEEEIENIALKIRVASKI